MNRLANETSPYLLQHAHNPVDWYPWGDEALARAREEDKPILLSIGYSACHWCHVMERESFEDPATADLMNQHFISIKVDREERPDLDAIYMQAVQAMTGSGGWPMTVFLTPDGVPFYGGTYFPPDDRHGLPSFKRILTSLADAYQNRRQELTQTTDQLMGHLRQEMGAQAAAGSLLAPTLLDQASRTLQRRFDAQNGGFGAAPKFPQAMALDFLLRAYHRGGNPSARHAVEHTLRKMARGGMYDQLGGGFHRYSVDAQWLVPHFEKMCYDNALLSRLYLDAYRAFGDDEYRRIAQETLEYVQRDLTSAEGGFFATLDADSEGEEGVYYIWSPQEVEEHLGAEDGRIFDRYYGLSDGPNFEGKNIPHVPRDRDVVAHMLGITMEALDESLARGRAKLLAARAGRVPPGRDEKILASWNGLMLRSFARAAATLGRADFRETAIRNGEFLTTKMSHGGRLWRSYKDGRAKLNGYLEDYAAVANGLLDLWELTFDLRWFTAASELADAILAHFYDAAVEGFYDTSDDHESLIVRPRNLQDNATPSGSALAAELLLRLAAFTEDAEYERIAATLLRGMADLMQRYPLAFGHWLGALDFYLGPRREIAIMEEPDSAEARALLDVVWRRYLPRTVLAAGSPGGAAAQSVPLLMERPQVDGQATAYVCRNHTCQAPVTEPEALASQIA